MSNPPFFLPFFVMTKPQISTPSLYSFSSRSLPLTRARWDLSAEKCSLNTDCQVHSPLASLPRLFPGLASPLRGSRRFLYFTFMSAWLFNKQNGSQVGHWEKASARVIFWCNVPTFPPPEHFLFFFSPENSLTTLVSCPIVGFPAKLP